MLAICACWSTSFPTPFPTFIVSVSVSHGLGALTAIILFKLITFWKILLNRIFWRSVVYNHQLWEVFQIIKIKRKRKIFSLRLESLWLLLLWVVIKGSLRCSWMNSLINPKFIFASVAKRVFVQNYWYENICQLYVHSLENQVIFMWKVLHKHSFWERSKRHAKRHTRPALIPVSVAWNN